MTKFFNIRKSFSTKLSVTIMSLAVPVFFISLGILFLQSRYVIRKEAMGRANGVLSTTMQRIDRYLTTIETATNANCLFVKELLHPDSLLALTRYIVSFNPNIDGCSISMEPNTFPELGRYFSVYTIREQDSIISVVEEPYEYFSKVWYKTPLELDSPCWVDYFDDADSLEVTLSGMLASYGRPIRDAAGHTVGIISTDISLTRLSKTISREKPYPNSYFMMVDRDGHYVVHPDTTRLFTHSIFEDADPNRQADLIALGHEMTKGRTGSMSLEIDGVPSLVTYKSLPGVSWSLALVCPDSDILEAYHQQTHILVPLLIIGLIFILLLCHHAVANAISPLNVLFAKTREIAGGNMEVHIPNSKRLDAVGSLQNSFASMLQRLNFHMGSVRYTTELAQRRYEELAEATRLAEEAGKQKTTFIQNVTHQIRTPLNIIMGFAQILSNCQDTPLSEEEMKSIASTMDHNSKLLGRILMMLFDSSDLGFYEELNSNKHDHVCCNKVAKEVIGYIKLQYPDLSISFSSEVSDNFCINTNHLYLMRSLRELLYNSAKYSDGKHVSLRVILEGTTHRYVCFIVEDTGKGISEADYERMFTFFAKEDDLSEGLGLGLPLAKRHILNLGGDIIIDKDYHGGCRFIVKLPYT